MVELNYMYDDRMSLSFNGWKSFSDSITDAVWIINKEFSNFPLSLNIFYLKKTQKTTSNFELNIYKIECWKIWFNSIKN